MFCIKKMMEYQFCEVRNLNWIVTWVTEREGVWVRVVSEWVSECDEKSIFVISVYDEVRDWWKDWMSDMRWVSEWVMSDEVIGWWVSWLMSDFKIDLVWWVSNWINVRLFDISRCNTQSDLPKISLWSSLRIQHTIY